MRSPRLGGSRLAPRAVLALLLAACASGPNLDALPPGWDLGAQARAYHYGPLVAAGDTATRRWCEPLFGALPDDARPVPEARLTALAERLREGFTGENGALLTLSPDAEDPRLLVAVVRGSERPDEVVALLVDTASPTGAADAAWAVEGALALIGAVEGRAKPRAVAEGGAGADVPPSRLRVERPLRSIALVLGPAPAEALLSSGAAPPLAAVVVEGLAGPADPERTVLLLERGPDPGAATPLPPDPAGEWSPGAGAASNTVALVARMALVDAGTVSRPWGTAEHPYQASASLQPLVAAGIPCARLHRHREDPEEAAAFFEVERAVVAAFAAAAGLADARPEDLARQLDSLLLERRLRLGAATEAELPGVAEAWEQWLSEARRFGRALCLGLDLPASPPPR